ncbi:hypothetical protein HYV80_01675 [Candidatus Woesearchaeota archaeon]|nr:hypothetical protein [Candidatus Woesearchaeota archaeon]
MQFKYQPLEKIAETSQITLPQQQISSRVWLNALSNWLVHNFLERGLDISENLDITESTFKPPVETKWPENNVVRVRHYRASDDFAVVVLPQRRMTRPNKVEGYNLAPVIASYLATNGISAYEIETPLSGTRRPKGKTIDELFPNLETFKSTFQQAVAEVRGVLDFATERGIGICGISQGAMYASIVYGVDNRVSAACLLMGAGDLADLILDSRSKDPFVLYLKSLVSQRGTSGEKIREEFSEIDPCSYANPYKGENLLMINGKSDKKLPIEYPKRLALAWKRGESMLLKGGHGAAILQMPYVLPRILEHYQRTPR